VDATQPASIPPRAPHLIKRGFRYDIRRRVPLDLVSIIGKSEITKALGTSDRSEAVERCRLDGVRLDHEWSALRATSHATRAIAAAYETAPITVGNVQQDLKRAYDEAQEYHYRYVKDEGFEEEKCEHFEADARRQAAVLCEAHKLAGIRQAGDSAATRADVEDPGLAPPLYRRPPVSLPSTQTPSVMSSFLDCA
jgi:hypothetical protein